MHHYALGPRSSLLARAPYDQFLTTGGPGGRETRETKAPGWLLVVLPAGAGAALVVHAHAPLPASPTNPRTLPNGRCAPTDYSPLLRDLHGHVLDAESQQAPHLAPGEPLLVLAGTPRLSHG